MVISGLDCGSSAWASMCVSRALLSDHVRSQCWAIASVSDSAELAPKVDRVVLAGYKLFRSSLNDSVSLRGGFDFDNNAGY